MNIEKIRYTNGHCKNCSPLGSCPHGLNYKSLKRGNFPIMIVHIGKPSMFMKWFEVYGEGAGKYSYSSNELYTEYEIINNNCHFYPGLKEYRPEPSLDTYLKFDQMPVTFDIVLGKSGVCSRNDARKNGWNFPLPQERDFEDFWLVYGKKKQTLFFFCNYLEDRNFNEYDEGVALNMSREFWAIETYERF